MKYLQTTCKCEKPFSSIPNKKVILTTLYHQDGQKDSNETEKIAIEDIQKHNSPRAKNKSDIKENEINCTLDFLFEKQRLEQIGDNKLAQFKVEGPIPEVDIRDPQVTALKKEQKLFLENIKAEVKKWGTILRVLLIAMGIFSILTSLFSIIFIFVIAIKTPDKILIVTLTMAANLVASLWLMNLALQGRGVSGCLFSKMENISSFIRLSLITVILYLIQLVIMTILKSIPDSLKEAQDVSTSENDDDAAAEGYASLGYIIVWAMCINNLALAGLAITFSLLIRRQVKLQELCELKMNILPIGYQIYSDLQQSQCKSTSNPYNI